MENERIKISIPVIVEGKYDKITLSNIIDANIITTDGFAIFNSKEKMLLLKKISNEGIIILTDSDGAGKVIRSHIKSAVPPEKIYDLYVPRIEGKEKRKKTPSKEGTLGVEGINKEILYGIFRKFAENHTACGDFRGREAVTKADFYEFGLTGAANSAKLRNRFAKSVGLPPDMTPNALLAAVNILMQRDEFINILRNNTDE